jgi:hypothetical protein
MPYEIEKLDNGKYKVFNSLTGHVFSKKTTLPRAKSQVRYLQFVNAVQKAECNAEWEKSYRSH